MIARLRWLFARLPLPMLALAASYGVYSYALLFAPPWVAVAQAAAFELTYIGLAVSPGFDLAQRKRATMISIGAVAASVIYNTLAGWFHAQPQLLANANATAWLCLAVLHGAPLAWVAYLVADLLLHTAPQIATATPPHGIVITPQPTATAPQITATAPQLTADRIPVAPDRLVIYQAILAAFARDPAARTADLATAARVSARTAESRRSELVKLGALHKTADGYARNGVELVAE